MCVTGNRAFKSVALPLKPTVSLPKPSFPPEYTKTHTKLLIATFNNRVEISQRKYFNLNFLDSDVLYCNRQCVTGTVQQ